MAPRTKAGELNDRQRAFCEEYVKDFNGKQAAIRAGYSESTAESMAWRLIKMPKVSLYIDQLKRERSERTKIDGDWVLVQLSEMFDADIGDIISPITGTFLPIHDWPPVWRRMVTGIDVSELRRINEALMGEAPNQEMLDTLSIVSGHVSKIKWIDRLKALELIGKHVDVQAFREKVDNTHTGPNGGPIQGVVQFVPAKVDGDTD